MEYKKIPLWGHRSLIGFVIVVFMLWIGRHIQGNYQIYVNGLLTAYGVFMGRKVLYEIKEILKK